MASRIRWRLAALCLALLTLAPPSVADDMVLVLDASNSMWGQIDGRAKIVIARDVMARLLDEVPAETPLALVAYGHRREADCGDVETLVPSGRDNHADIARAVESLTPRGKTPLAGAVSHALSMIDGGEAASAIVVVTDGVESCDGDPCAVIEAARQAGATFTLHTVALGVGETENDELRCMAAAGGGRHYAARDAVQLLEGLRQAVAATPPSPIGAADDVREGAFGTPPRADRRRLGLADPVFAEELMETDADGFTRLRFGDDSRLNIGANSQVVLDRFVYDPASSAGELAVDAARGVFRFISGQIDRGGVTLRSPVATIGIRGTDLLYEVTADGTTQVWVLDGQVVLTANETGAEAILDPFDSARVGADGAIETADFELPDDDGLALIAGDLSLSARVTGPDGAVSDPEVTWDIVTADGARPLSPFVATQRRAHVPAGEYRVTARHDGRVEERRVVVTDDEDGIVDIHFEIIPASIEVGVNASLGATIDVGWQGPAGDGDSIAVAEQGMSDDQRVNAAYVREGNPLPLRMPDWPGVFEVRYIEAGGRVLARERIEVDPVEVAIDAPGQAPAGSNVAVGWSGPDNPSDYLTVVAAGTPDGQHGNYTYTRTGSPLELKMPDTAGAFEIRYVSHQSRRVLARQAIELEPITATIEAPASAAAGSNVAVGWSGPDNPSDYLTVVAAGTPDGQHGNYTYTRTGSPLELKMPDTAGAFEIRYVSHQSRRVLARQAIELEPITATIEAPASAAAGSSVAVGWSGPDNPSDYLTVVATGTPDGQHGNYTYTRTGSPLELKMPDTAGTFEIRYVSHQSRRVLARQAIELEPITATIEAPASAAAGSNVAVGWSGPDNPSDYLTVVAAGTPDGQHGNYTYTRTGSPLELKMPDTAGTFEIRYVSHQSRRVLARQAIRLDAVPVSLDAPDRAEAGRDISVSWSGPDNAGDFLTVVTEGTPDGQHGNYTYTRSGDPLTLTTPDVAGRFEIRYVSGQSRAVFARRVIDLSAPEVNIDLPGQFIPGAELPVFWHGPDNRGDYLSLVPAGSDAGASGPYVYTREGTPTTMTAPESAGEFEVRYVSGQSRRVLASATTRPSDPPATVFDCEGFELSYQRDEGLIFGRYTPAGQTTDDGRLFARESNGAWVGVWTQQRGDTACEAKKNGVRFWGRVSGSMKDDRPALAIGNCDAAPSRPWDVGECRRRP